MSCIVLSEQAFTILAKEAITYTQPWEVYLLISNQITRLVSLSLIVLGSADMGMNVSLDVIIIICASVLKWYCLIKKKKKLFDPYFFNQSGLHIFMLKDKVFFSVRRQSFILCCEIRTLCLGEGFGISVCSCFYIVSYSK